MKKVVSFLVVFVLLFSFTSISAAAEPDVLIDESVAVESETPDLPIAEEQAAEVLPEATETATSDFTYQVHTNGRTASITGYTGSETSITIPSVIDGYKITDIGSQFQNTEIGSDLSSVNISDGITKISYGAFSYMRNLEYVYLPSTLKIIDSSTFEGCKLLDNVNIPPSVRSIGYSAFEGCSSLEQVNIPEYVERLSNSAFEGCSALKKVVLPSNIYLGSNVFKDCTFLTNIDMSGVLGYETGVFEGCINLKTVKLPTYYHLIPGNTFAKCISLKSITIPASVIDLQIGSFAGCSSLEKINILPSSSLVSIGPKVFEGCHKLSSISLPNNVRYIGSKAFSYCESITEISLPTSLKEIKSKVFENCISLKTAFIANSIKTIESNAFTGCPKTLTIKSPSGSAAETFAKKQGFRFEAIADPQKLEAPKNFKAKAYTGGKIRLTWNETPGASGYYIYKASHLNGTYKSIAAVSTRTSYTHSRILPNRNVYYKIVPYVEIAGIKYKGSTAGPIVARTIK